MQEEETNNLPDTFKDGWRHSTPWSPEVVEFPRCNNAGIEWYGRIPTDPPMVDPKGEKLLGQCEEEDSTQKQPIPGHIIGSTLGWIGMYAGIRVIPCLSVRLNIQEASLERKGDTVLP